MKWYLHACPACGGDLHEDVEDGRWLVCFLCSRTYLRDQMLGASPEHELLRQIPVVEPDAHRAA